MDRKEATRLVKRALRKGHLLEPEAKALVSAWGIEIPRSVVAVGPEDIAGVKIRPPFVLKVVSQDILHKTDVGGVEVDLRSENEAIEALSEMKRDLAKRAPKARIDGFLLEEMVPGQEVIVGGLRDPQFGPVIMFGIGGTAVELLKDVSFRLAPLSREEVFEMMREVKSYPLLTGFRGSKPVDLESLVDVVIALSNILDVIEEIDEIEINPLMASERRAVAADVRVVLRD